MVLTKSERIEVGKKVHEGDIAKKDAVEKYGVGAFTVTRWVRLYLESAASSHAQNPVSI